MIRYAKDNVIRKFNESDLKGENVINQEHLYTIVHSRIFDCDPHTKVKYKGADVMYKQSGDTLVVFVPTTATSSVEIPDSIKRCILDIRSYEGKGKQVFDVFHNLIGEYSVMACSAFGEKGKIYMTADAIYDEKSRGEHKGGKKINTKITVLLDRYTLSELDEFCSMLLAYFYGHYEVKGTPHKMSKFIFKPIRIGETNKKINICVPVLKLIY